MSNHTCPFDAVPKDPVPFYTNGNLNFKAHDVGWIICGFLTLISSMTSFWLIWKHLTYYTCPQQQRHIIRMLFMVPIYSIISLLSYIFYPQAVYFETMISCYEAVVITSFFYLLLQYVGDTPSEQNEVFRMVKLKKWFWPLNYWRYRPDGLTFLWLMKIYILQYSILQPLCSLAAVGLQYFDLYCLESWEPWFGHIYLSLIVSISVSVAMYCIIQFYLPIQKELKPYDPVLKFLAVKSVVFLTFWQDSFISLLVYFGAIKKSEYFSTADIQVGLDALLITFEMCIFGFLHIKAFTYLVYRPKDRSRTTKRWKAFLDVCDYRDWYYLMKQTSRYIGAKSKGRDFSMVEDIRRDKYQHLQNALGRERWSHLQIEREKGKESMPSFWNEGCEPGSTLLLENESNNEKDMEKNAADPSPEIESRQPRGNLAMRPDYDPENEDEEGPMDELSDHQSLLQQSDSNNKVTRLLPTLPKVEVESIKDMSISTSKKERYPELSQYHQTALDDDFQEEEKDVDDIFIPRKGGRARKEASLGLGAFWRQFRERISGSQIENNKEEEGDEDENMIESNEIDNNFRKRFIENGADAINTTDSEINGKSSSSDASQSAIRSRDSPLTEFIRGRKENEKPVFLAKIKHTNSSNPIEIDQSNQDKDNIKRQRSDRAYISPPSTIQSQPQQQPPPPIDIMHSLPLVRTVSLKAPIPRKPVGDIESIAPSISVWSGGVGTSAQDHLEKSQGKSVSRPPSEPIKLTKNALQVAGLSSSTSINRSNSANDQSIISLSTTELQRQLQSKEQKRSNLIVKGPKGKRIEVVLPNALSPEGLPEVKPVLPPPVPQIPTSLIPGSGQRSTTSSSQYNDQNNLSSNRQSKIRFTEIKPPKPDPKNDPEAEIPKVNGWVIAGGKSLKQVREMEEEEKKRKEEIKARAAFEEKERQRKLYQQQQMERQRQWEYQQQQHRQQRPQSAQIVQSQPPRSHSNDNHSVQHIPPGSSIRERRISAPPIPSNKGNNSTKNEIHSQEHDQQQQQRTSIQKLMGKRQKEKVSLPPPLPAPSQLSGSDVQNVLFGVVNESLIGGQQNHASSSSNHRNQQNENTSKIFHQQQSQNQIQIGSIVSRRDVFNAMAPVVAPPQQFGNRMNGYLPPGAGSGNSYLRPIVQPTRSNISISSPPSWPQPPLSPMNAIGSSFGSRIMPPPQRPPIHRSHYQQIPARQTMYDPYTGEPLQRQLHPSNQYHQQQRPQQHHYPQQRNSNRPQTNIETREGFHFDYID